MDVLNNWEFNNTVEVIFCETMFKYLIKEGYDYLWLYDNKVDFELNGVKHLYPIYSGSPLEHLLNIESLRLISLHDTNKLECMLSQNCDIIYLIHIPHGLTVLKDK